MSTAQILPQKRAAGVFCVNGDMLSMHYGIDCDGRRRHLRSCYLAVCSSEMKDKNSIVSLRFDSFHEDMKYKCLLASSMIEGEGEGWSRYLPSTDFFQ